MTPISWLEAEWNEWLIIVDRSSDPGLEQRSRQDWFWPFSSTGRSVKIRPADGRNRHKGHGKALRRGRHERIHRVDRALRPRHRKEARRTLPIFFTNTAGSWAASIRSSP